MFRHHAPGRRGVGALAASSLAITRGTLYSACRRVARTIYMGSAPVQKAANRGLDDRRVKLGCVQPGESVATFGDALRRLTDRATYLYVDGKETLFRLCLLAADRRHAIELPTELPISATTQADLLEWVA